MFYLQFHDPSNCSNYHTQPQSQRSLWVHQCHGKCSKINDTIFNNWFRVIWLPISADEDEIRTISRESTGIMIQFIRLYALAVVTLCSALVSSIGYQHAWNNI